MDNTRIISPNGTSYGMPNDKIFKSNGLPLQKNGYRCDHRKGVINTGPIYKMCSGNGNEACEAKILMNSQSLFHATAMQFLPPTRNKSTICSEIDLPNTPTVKIIKQATFVTQPASVVLSTVKPISYFPNATVTPRTELMIEQNNIFITKPRTINLNKGSSKFFNDSPMQQPTEGKTIVNTIKSYFINYFLKPIIDTTTMIVGSDSNTKPTIDAASDPQMFWSDSDNSPKNKNHNTMPMYSDNRSSDSFCYSSENPKIFMNFMPETYFDCDDYIEGGEDTIDFVADSTKEQWQSFGDEFDDAPIKPLLKTSNSFDCIDKEDIIKSCEQLPEIEREPEREHELQSKRANETEFELNVSTTEDETVQYNEEKEPIKCLKYEKPKRNSYRRKRKGKRKHKSANRQKAAAANKNRHEKIRHEVAMNIHDDIENCSVVKGANAPYSHDSNDFDDQDEDIDLEIIDVDDDNSPKSQIMSTPTPTKLPSPTKSMAELKVPIEMPIPSPEMIPTGCIFTRFFRFDRPCGKKRQQSLPLRCTQKQVPQIKAVKERPMTSRRSSETESDDSFIVFEDCSPRSTASIDDLMSKHAALKDTYRRQRQLSECSDDFILFEDDADDCSRRYDTTDEDFTDSTDDSDSSEDDSSDESDSSDCSPAPRQEHPKETNQPDSGFEEKKVTFNLCPIVHEIRAWRYAYSEARKGKWEQMGRDRERFENRINEVSRILSPVFNVDHRQKIYGQRFCGE